MSNNIHKDATIFEADCAQVPEDSLTATWMSTRNPEGICITNIVNNPEDIFDNTTDIESIFEHLKKCGLQVVLSLEDAIRLQEWLAMEIPKYKKHKLTKLITE